MTDKSSCDAATAVVLRAFGRIDVLVNNAGITQPVTTLQIERPRATLRRHDRLS